VRFSRASLPLSDTKILFGKNLYKRKVGDEMIQPIGYFKLYRELFSKPIWLNSTAKQQSILITLLAMANFKENEWDWNGKRFKIQPGQFVTSLESIVKQCSSDVTVQNVRTALARFVALGFLTSEPTNKNRLITITNWALYQEEQIESNKQTNKQLTSVQQATNKQLTTKEESNKDNKDKKIISNIVLDEFFDSVWLFYPVKKGKKSVSLKQKEILFKIGYDELKRCFERYEKNKEDWKAFQQGSTFFNSGYFDYLDKNYNQPENNPQPKSNGNGVFHI
jgi:hypothetical protein